MYIWHVVCDKLTANLLCEELVKYFLSVFFVFSTFYIVAQDDIDVVKVGEKAPEFTVKTIGDKTICLSALRGKYVLLNFFATWCKPCLQELPVIEKHIAQQFSSDKIVVIAIGREHSLNELQLFNERKKFTFHIAADPKRSIYNMYAKKFIPRSYLIAPNGELIYVSSGYTSTEFEKLVRLIDSKVK